MHEVRKRQIVLLVDSIRLPLSFLEHNLRCGAAPSGVGYETQPPFPLKERMLPTLQT